MRSHCRIVGIEGTAKESHYSVRELCASDLTDLSLLYVWALVFEESNFVVILCCDFAGPTILCCFTFLLWLSYNNLIIFMHVHIVDNIIIDLDVLHDGPISEGVKSWSCVCIWRAATLCSERSPELGQG